MDPHKEYRAEYYQTNKEKITDRSIKWQQDNKEAHNNAVARYAKKNPEVSAAATRKWREQNKDSLPYRQKAIVSRLKARAKKSGIPFDLDLEHIQSIWPEDDCCPVLGTKFTTDQANIRTSASVDRIVPDKGYTKGNVSIMSHKANTIKTDATLDEIRAMVTWLERAQP